jgi:hypothetical protein
MSIVVGRASEEGMMPLRMSAESSQALQKKRGLCCNNPRPFALLLVFLGGLAGIIVLLPVTSWLIHVLEWARDHPIAGCFTLGVVFVPVALLSRESQS